MSKTPFFDVVIPVHKKDLAILEYCIAAAKKKLVGVRKIIVISKEKYSQNAEWYDESKFPFSFQEVADYVGHGNAGWYFQQLLKMYAALVIPDIAPNVFVLDSDTVFFKKTRLFDDENRTFFTLSKDEKICRKPFDQRVDRHIEKLFPEISRKKLPTNLRPYSGIAHNMMFNCDFVRELFSRVEKYHGGNEKFYQTFLRLADKQHSVAEYQTYFNFMAIFHPEKVVFRKLKYKNTADINIRKYQARMKYDYCSFHSYLRQQRGNSLKTKFEKIACKIFKKLFQIQQWNIGIVKSPIADFLTMPNQKIIWLKSPKINEFRADPFGLIHDGKKIIFYEKYCFLKRKGQINALEIDDNFNIISERKILEKKSHLSYPFLFENDEKIYCIIEDHRSCETAIYQLQDDLSLTKITTIFAGEKIIDPTIIKYDGRFFMFFTKHESGDGKLFIAHSDSLLGDWVMHKNNPVKEDVSNSRPAGAVFEHDGELFRAAQNCRNSYGASIKLNKITKLSTEEFAEIEEIEITPNQLGKYPRGLHNIAKLGENLTVIDGKRNLIVPHKFLISLARIVCRIFRRC